MPLVTEQARRIVASLPTRPSHCTQWAAPGRGNTLMLSYRRRQGYSYYPGGRPGGGGRKRTPVSPARAAELVQQQINDGAYEIET